MDYVGTTNAVTPVFSGILATLIVGLIIGFIADRIMGPGGLGLVWSIVLGLIGSLVGGFLFSMIGVGPYGLIGQIMVGIVGACIVLYAARKLRHV